MAGTPSLTIVMPADYKTDEIPIVPTWTDGEEGTVSGAYVATIFGAPVTVSAGGDGSHFIVHSEANAGLTGYVRVVCDADFPNAGHKTNIEDWLEVRITGVAATPHNGFRNPGDLAPPVPDP